jgi:hypothetical protein
VPQLGFSPHAVPYLAVFTMEQPWSLPMPLQQQQGGHGVTPEGAACRCGISSGVCGGGGRGLLTHT